MRRGIRALIKVFKWMDVVVLYDKEDFIPSLQRSNLASTVDLGRIIWPGGSMRELNVFKAAIEAMPHEVVYEFILFNDPTLTVLLEMLLSHVFSFDWLILRTLFPPILRRASFAGLRSPTTPPTQSFTDSLPPLQIQES
ncbi:hypothetical protein ACLB2K_002148 [Fragaria x ananassa]